MANISEPQLIRLINTLVKKECPNCHDGFCDAKDKPCSWRREEEPFTNRGITCGWLRDAVLPLDKELRGFYENWKQAELIRREKKDAIVTGDTDTKALKVDVCVGCRQPMVVRSVRQKYCDTCRETQRRIKVAAAVRKHRDKSSQM